MATSHMYHNLQSYWCCSTLALLSSTSLSRCILKYGAKGISFNNDTIILHGGGDKKLIEERCAEAPAFTIASNAGFDGALFIGRLLEQDNHNLGFDAAKGVYVDMVEERIIDPLKVVRTALVDGLTLPDLSSLWHV
ncbi:chaperonin CPN60-like 2, mitochondrial [Quercus lobata]|uniref:chaperonin CPN60-like 2, mitochondrial n=1 Tax=Quercus lobata TaxID=97700 RepID=UPI001248E256|nr:chaperonin CPN60-like 2, mitochondrial [Quercus lobata]